MSRPQTLAETTSTPPSALMELIPCSVGGIGGGESAGGTGLSEPVATATMVLVGVDSMTTSSGTSTAAADGDASDGASARRTCSAAVRVGEAMVITRRTDAGRTSIDTRSEDTPAAAANLSMIVVRLAGV